MSYIWMCSIFIIKADNAYISNGQTEKEIKKTVPFK